MKRSLLLAALTFFSYTSFAQVGISNTDPKASLDITASNTATPSITDGILIPRIDEFPASNPGADQDGMLVFVTGAGTPAEGFYYWDNASTGWVTVSGTAIQKIDELTDGKSDNDGSNDGSSIFLGIDSGRLDDSSDNRNIGIGYNSLYSTISAQHNSALGYRTLATNTSGNENTAMGYEALWQNTSGSSNSAFGNAVLFSNSDGIRNTAMGNQSMLNNTSGDSNVALGYAALMANSTADYNSGVGYRALASNTLGSQNSALGYRVLNGNTTGDNNTAIGGNAGFSNISGSGNVFIGNSAGYNETGSNKLYIDNSDADSVNALIYGEFDNDILRTNAEFQIGNPASTGYALPATDGTANQVLATDGAGQITFVSPNSSDAWYEEGTTSAPNNINDDIFTQGFVAIGKNTADSSLDIQLNGTSSDPVILAIQDNSTGTGTHTGIQMGLGGTHNESIVGSANYINNTGTGLHTGYVASVSSGGGNQVGIRATTNGANGSNTGLSTSVFNSGSASSEIQTGVNAQVSQPTSQISYGIFNTLNANGSNATGIKYGIYNLVTGGTTNSHYGIYNDVRGTNNNSKYGTYNRFGIGTTNTDGALYGTYNDFGSSITSSFNKYGTYTNIPSALNGTHYGIYSDVRNASGYSAYFIGRASFGNALSNRYLMPAADGTANQVISTNGSGQLTFVDAPDTDDQTIDNLGLMGNTLGISLEDDGQPVQTVDLSNVDFNVSNFALAKMTMSADQSVTSGSYVKMNFDTTDFDIGSNFDTTLDRFDVSEDGYYRISTVMGSQFSNATNVNVDYNIYVNGVSVKRHLANHHASGFIHRIVETVQYLSAGQYIEVYIFVSSNITVSSHFKSTTFEVERIR